MKSTKLIFSSLLLVLMLALVSGSSPKANSDNQQSDKPAIKVHYLEIVTPKAEETCKVLSIAHGVEFGDPIPEFGNARTAILSDGGRIGVRAPMRDSEKPVVRPYVLVDDVVAAVNAAKKAGAEVAIPPMEMPGGQGKFSIYILGGIEHGLWQI